MRPGNIKEINNLALTRLNEFNTGTTLTESALEGEFDQIYNSALTLISPLTADLACGGFRLTGLALGTVGSPGLQFTGDTNTGVYSSGADTIALAGGGIQLLQCTSVPTAAIVNINPAAITATANTDIARLQVGNTSALTIPAGTTADVASVTLQEPNLTATGTVTVASTLHIVAAPTEGTSNYALFVDAGITRLDGALLFSSGTVTTATGTAVSGSATILQFSGGSTATTWLENTSTTERMRLTDGGILALGTTVTTGAAAGNLQLARSATGYRMVNNAGTNSVALIGLTTADAVILADGGGDIRWGNALVALGGGSAPTLGTIGGSGPATAAQNTWMRVIDSAGAAFWVPAWK
mgnify:CR=1 FL=1